MKIIYSVLTMFTILIANTEATDASTAWFFSWDPSVDICSGAAQETLVTCYNEVALDTLEYKKLEHYLSCWGSVCDYGPPPEAPCFNENDGKYYFAPILTGHHLFPDDTSRLALIDCLETALNVDPTEAFEESTAYLEDN